MFIYLSIFWFFLLFNSYAIPVIPDKIEIPAQLKNRTPDQIQAVFSSMEKQHNQKTANLWKLKYYKALFLKEKNTKSFCEIMKELSATPAFPLKELALIQSYELCSYSEKLYFKPEQFPKWLRLRLAKAFYKRRKIFKDSENSLKAAIYLAQNSLFKDLRISYLKHALSLAREQKKDQTATLLRESLHKEAPRFKPKPNVNDFLLIAEDLRQNRNFQKAIKFYIKILNSQKINFNEKNLSFKGLDLIYKIQRNNKKKIANLRRWSHWLLKENTKQSLIMHYNLKLNMARQQWNLNENEKAIQLATDILQKENSEPIHPETLYLRGLVYNQEKKTDMSLTDWSNAINILRKNKKKNNSSVLKKILWKRAWLFRNQKKYKQALRDLVELEKINQNPYTHYKVLFWKGKTLQNLSRKTLAKKSFKKLIKKDHFGYYGLLAHKMLGKKPAFQKKQKSLEEMDFLSENQPGNSLAHWLILFKESELLSQFLDTQQNFLLNQQQKQTEQDWLKMITLWIKSKKYLEVFQSLEQMDDKIKKSFSKKYTHLLFPLDFSEIVNEASQKWNIPKALIFAIIRQESAFNVRARSAADAFGLMQLIPSTARQTAKKFKLPYRSFRDLYNPSKNISLGTAYLKSLLGHYNSFVFSVAAYNAGGTPVNKWRENIKNTGVLDFIENIPYEETRTYLRLIIRNYIFYHNKLDEESHWFPDWLLQ